MPCLMHFGHGGKLINIYESMGRNVKKQISMSIYISLTIL